MPLEPEDGWLVLRHAAGHDVLDHTGTGELVPLAGRWQLSVVDDAVKLYSSSGSESFWARERLAKALYRVDGPDGHGPRRFIMEVATSTSTWRDDVLYSPSRTLVFQYKADKSLDLECYHSSLAKPRCVRFNLPRVLDFVIGGAFDGDWICRRKKMLRKYMSDVGVPEDHLVTSMWAARHTALSRKQDLTDQELTMFDQEFSTTAEASIAIACALATGRTHVTAHHDVDAHAAFFIDALAAKCSTGDGAPLAMDFARGSRGEVRLCGAVVHFTTGDHRLAQRFAGLCGGSISAPVGQVMLKCHMAMRQKGRNPTRYAMAEVIFSSLLELVASTVEASRGEAFWTTTNSLQLPPLYRDGSTKARRVSIRFKLEVCSAVATNPSLQTPAQFLAAAQAKAAPQHMKREKTKRKWITKHQLRAGSASAFSKTEMSQYLVTGRLAMRSLANCSIILDATRAGGKDWMLVGAYSHESRQAMWLPPQAAAFPALSARGGVWLGALRWPKSCLGKRCKSGPLTRPPPSDP